MATAVIDALEIKNTGGKTAGATAIKATGLMKWFGEGEARTSAVKDVNLEMWFGEMEYIVGPSGREDDAAECSFRDSQAGCGHGDGGRNRYLASEQR